MIIKLKTKFWEKLDLKKVIKLILTLTIIHLMNTIIIAIKGMTIPTIVNGITILILSAIIISYNKYEGTEKWKKQQSQKQ